MMITVSPLPQCPFFLLSLESHSNPFSSFAGSPLADSTPRFYVLPFFFLSDLFFFFPLQFFILTLCVASLLPFFF